MNKLMLLLPLVLLISACGSPKPEAVAKTYWQGVINNDAEQVSQVSSSQSNNELRRAIAPDQSSQVKFGETTIEGDRAQVETFLTWVGEDKKQAEFELFTVLIQEDEQWKIDTARTRQQFFTAVYRSSLNGLSSILAESLASFQVFGEETADNMAEELEAAIDEIQRQSSDVNIELQSFLEALDEDLREVIEEMNQTR